MFQGNTLSIYHSAAKTLNDADRLRLSVLLKKGLASDAIHCTEPNREDDHYWLINQGSQLIAAVQHHSLWIPDHVNHQLTMDTSPLLPALPFTKHSVLGQPLTNSLYIGQLRQLMVAPAFQRQGLGKILVQQVEKYIHQQGQRHHRRAICLLHARVSALDFYRQLGYRPMTNQNLTMWPPGHRQPISGGCSGVHYRWLYRCLEQQ